MLSRHLARALRHEGIHVASACDGDDMEDGEITIAANVHVQIPTFGEAPRVIVDTFNADTRCYPPRETVEELADDIRKALNDAPSALASSYIH